MTSRIDSITGKSLYPSQSLPLDRSKKGDTISSERSTNPNLLPELAICLIQRFRNNRDPSLSLCLVSKDWHKKIRTYRDGILQPTPLKLLPLPLKENRSVVDQYVSEPHRTIHVKMSCKAETCPADDYAALVNKETSAIRFLNTDGLGGCIGVITYHDKMVSLSHLTHGVNWDNYKSWLSKNSLISKDTVVALVGGLSDFEGSHEMVKELEKIFSKNSMHIVARDLFGNYSRSVMISTTGELTVQKWKFIGMFSMKMVLQPQWSLSTS